jgi:hypothetical protein
MLILTVFILAFGVPTYSLVHDVQKFSWHMPRHIINLAYWQIFGELNTMDDIDSLFLLKKQTSIKKIIFFFRQLSIKWLCYIFPIGCIYDYCKCSFN